MINMTAVGNLGRDPEQKTFEDGNSVVNFSIGCRTGKDETTWLNCAVWGKRGNTVMQFFTKGSRVTVAGPAKLREYTTKDGETGRALEMDVRDFTLPEKGADAAATPKQPQSAEIPF